LRASGGLLVEFGEKGLMNLNVPFFDVSHGYFLHKRYVVFGEHIVCGEDIVFGEINDFGEDVIFGKKVVSDESSQS
jgi:hypothetical protein